MRPVLAIVRAMILELFRKKDFYVLLIFLLVLLSLLSAQSFFDIEGISRYIRDFGYTLSVFFSLIVAVTFSARQIPEEITTRTVYPTLAKPISRFTLVLGKFSGCVAVSVISFALYFGVFTAFCMVEKQAMDPVLVLQSFYFGVLFLCLISAMVMFFSIFLTVSANVTISFLLYFLITMFSSPLRDLALTGKAASSVFLGILYYLVPHFDFFDLRIRLVHAWDPLEAWVVAAVTVYAIAYCALLLYLAGAVFRRKKL